MQAQRTILILTIAVIIGACVLAWGTFIWPTPYHYVKVSRPFYYITEMRTKEVVYRINRFSGTSEKVVDPAIYRR